MDIRYLNIQFSGVTLEFGPPARKSFWPI